MGEKLRQPVSGGKVANVPVILQLEALECGAACLSMILAYYGKWISLEQVRKDCGVSRDGSSAKNILYAARNYGMLASTRDGRAVALIPGHLSGYYFNDPETGKRTAVGKDSEDLFEREAICFYRPMPVRKMNFYDFGKYVFGTMHRSDLIILIGGAAAVAVIGLAVPAATQYLYSKVSGGSSMTVSILSYLAYDILLFAALFIGVDILMDSVIVRSLRKVNHSLEKITDGNLEEKVTAEESREFTKLSKDINLTVTSLKTYISEAENRINAELEFAKEIQYSALPSAVPVRKEFRLSAYMGTAKEVGGDFYDFFLPDEKHLVLIIADVSGKGIPAALFMHHFLYGKCGFGIQADHRLIQNPDGRFVNQCTHAFLMDLSFIGWWILGFLTFGLVQLFFLNPYQTGSWTELYFELRGRYIRNAGPGAEKLCDLYLTERPSFVPQSAQAGFIGGVKSVASEIKVGAENAASLLATGAKKVGSGVVADLTEAFNADGATLTRDQANAMVHDAVLPDMDRGNVIDQASEILDVVGGGTAGDAVERLFVKALCTELPEERIRFHFPADQTAGSHAWQSVRRQSHR